MRSELSALLGTVPLRDLPPAAVPTQDHPAVPRADKPPVAAPAPAAATHAVRPQAVQVEPPAAAAAAPRPAGPGRLWRSWPAVAAVLLAAAGIGLYAMRPSDPTRAGQPPAAPAPIEAAAPVPVPVPAAGTAGDAAPPEAERDATASGPWALPADSDSVARSTAAAAPVQTDRDVTADQPPAGQADAASASACPSMRAALGLCQSGNVSEAAPVATGSPVAPPTAPPPTAPPPTAPPPTAPPDARRAEAPAVQPVECTPAVAALGLCLPARP